MAHDDENVEDNETVEESAVTEGEGIDAPAEEEVAADAEASEFVPDILQKPKNDVYTALMILTFTAFFFGVMIAGRELWEHYDVQFFIFGKK